jgi:phosphate/sulfate permease
MSNASRRHDPECGVRHGTWTYPSSFGGLIGATLAAARPGAVHVTAVLGKVVLPALVSPLLAGLVAFAATFAAYRLTARAGRDGRLATSPAVDE